MDNNLQSGANIRLGQGAQLLGSIFYAAVMLGISLYLIKFGSMEQYGQFSAAMAMGAPIYMLANARGRLLLSSEPKHGIPTESYFTFRVISCGLCVVLMLGLCWLVQGNALEVVLAVAFFKAAEAISDILFGGYQRIGCPHFVGFSQVTRGIAFVIVLWIVWILGVKSVQGVVGSFAAVLCILTILDWAYLFRRLKSLTESDVHSVSIPVLLSVFHRVRPFMLVAFLASSLTVLPRLTLERYEDYASVGLYSAFMLFSSAALLVVSALGQPYLRDIAFLLELGTSADLYRLLKQMLVIPFAITAVFGLVFWGWRDLIRIFVLNDTTMVSEIYWLLVLAIVFLGGLSLLQWYVLMALGVRRQQIWLSGSSIFVVALLCYLLIPKYSIKGAFFADIGGLLFQACFSFPLIVSAISKKQTAFLK